MSRLSHTKSLFLGFSAIVLGISFSFSALAMIAPPPGIVVEPPTSISVTAASSSQVNVSWGASPAFALGGYRVYRCSGTGCTPTVQIGTVPSTTTNYSDSGLSSGTYVYAVTAYSGFGESVKVTSNAVSTQPRLYNINDFTTLVGQWNQSGSGITSDVNSDSVVNTKDIGVMMSSWETL